MKKGFTLAEILIVLTIIGVMAVMTIPSLIQNSNSQQKIALFKKGFNAISNAYATEFAVKTPPTSSAPSEKEKMWDALNNQLNVKYYVNMENGKKIYTTNEAKTIDIVSRVIVTEDKIGYKLGGLESPSYPCETKLKVNSFKKTNDYRFNTCMAITVIIHEPYTWDKVKDCKIYNGDNYNGGDIRDLNGQLNCNMVSFAVTKDGITSGNPDCHIAGRIISGNEYDATKCNN